MFSMGFRSGDSGGFGHHFPQEISPVKIHIWAGISCKGASRVVMFTGILNAVRLAEVLKAGLLPFIRENFTSGHCLFHDNDPKHSSKYVDMFGPLLQFTGLSALTKTNSTMIL